MSKSFWFGLARVPIEFHRGSLIPQSPFGGGRAATQSTSRGSLVVQCWPDYKVANRLVWFDIVLPSEFLQRHAQQSSDKREKEDGKRNNYIRIKQPIPAAYSEIFFIGGRSILSTTCPFYTGIQGAQSPYLAQTFTTDFLSVVYLKTVYFSFSLLYIDTKVN